LRNRALVAAATGLFIATLAVQAQQQAPANLVPLTAASLAAQPDLYIGQNVALYGTVEAQLSPTVFSMDQDARRAAMNEILVIAPTLQAGAPAGEYVTVVGKALLFTGATMATEAGNYKLDLPPDVITRYQGRPMVLALQVIDAANTDLAKAPPVPLTPEEEAFDAIMKRVNPTFGEVRKAIEASDASAAGDAGTRLRGLFDDTRKFFEARKTDDAAGWAGEAVSHLDAISKAVAGGDWNAAREAASKIQPLCAQCHNAHRERDEEGNYRVKKAQ